MCFKSIFKLKELLPWDTTELLAVLLWFNLPPQFYAWIVFLLKQCQKIVCVMLWHWMTSSIVEMALKSTHPCLCFTFWLVNWPIVSHTLTYLGWHVLLAFPPLGNREQVHLSSTVCLFSWHLECDCAAVLLPSISLVCQWMLQVKK